MSAKSKIIEIPTLSERAVSVIRYAIGATFIMALAMSSSMELSYIIPFLSLTFLTPPIKIDNIKTGIGFILIVFVTTRAGVMFTSLFYHYMWVYIPLLALAMIWIFYSTLGFVLKLFMLIALLVTPVPEYGMDPTIWSQLISNVLIKGSVLVVFMLLTVYTIFPDKAKTIKQKVKTPSHKERFTQAIETFIVTFPIVLLFIFYQWEDELLILLYIIVLIMMPQVGKEKGKMKLMGNLIGGAATLIFYELIVIVPNFTFFLILYMGTALLFASKIFSDDPHALYYKTAFSALTLIIGEISFGTSTAGREIWIRIIQVMTAVVYVVIALAVLDAFRKRRESKVLVNQKKIK